MGHLQFRAGPLFEDKPICNIPSQHSVHRNPSVWTPSILGEQASHGDGPVFKTTQSHVMPASYRGSAKQVEPIMATPATEVSTICSTSTSFTCSYIYIYICQICIHTYMQLHRHVQLIKGGRKREKWQGACEMPEVLCQAVTETEELVRRQGEVGQSKATCVDLHGCCGCVFSLRVPLVFCGFEGKPKGNPHLLGSSKQDTPICPNVGFSSGWTPWWTEIQLWSCFGGHQQQYGGLCPPTFWRVFFDWPLHPSMKP